MEQVPRILCDGCKEPIDDCICEELAAEYEEECGPVCGQCGGDACKGYFSCTFGDLYEPGECRYITGAY